jgi:hypothetical protein
MGIFSIDTDMHLGVVCAGYSSVESLMSTLNGATPSADGHPTEASKSWVSIFEDNRTLLRFLVAAAGVGAVVLAVFFAVIFVVESVVERKLNVEFHQGTVTIQAARGLEKSILLLPVNQPWTNTQIVNEENTKLEIDVTGSVNVAIHRLAEASEKGELPRYPWSGPGGVSEENNSCVDNDRKPTRLVPELKLGQVVAYIQAPGTLEPSQYKNQKPTNIEAVNDLGHISMQGVGTLWLGVNDTWIAPEFKKFYISTPECLTDAKYKVNGKLVEQADLIKRYDHYLKQNNFNANYLDNIGEFLVQVTKEKSK